jgi:hypothetical protein
MGGPWLSAKCAANGQTKVGSHSSSCCQIVAVQSSPPKMPPGGRYYRGMPMVAPGGIGIESSTLLPGSGGIQAGI